MNRRALVVKAAAVLVAVWGVVAGVRGIAESKRPTADKIARTIAQARFADWSQLEEIPDTAEAARREKELRRIADLFNRLDFHERERGREQRVGEEFFRNLAVGEKRIFIDLTISESMNRMMEAIDAMSADERKRLVKRGLDEIAERRTEEEMTRAKELGSDLVAKVTQEGMRAYYEKASVETKLDLAPLMEAMNEVMEGLRGQGMSHPQR